MSAMAAFCKDASPREECATISAGGAPSVSFTYDADRQINLTLNTICPVVRSWLYIVLVAEKSL